MSSGSRLHPTLILLVTASVAIGGCTPRTLDADQLERRLGREVSEKLGVPRIVAECPDGVEARQGSMLVCVVRAPGETAGLRIEVTQLDDDGNVTWEIAGVAR